MSDLTGQTVAGYPIQKLLNRGAYDELYQVASSGAPLAARVLRGNLRSDAAISAAVTKGWEAGRAVTHANLVTMFSTGTDPSLGAFTLEELPPGKSLRQMILGGPKIAWRDCLVLTEQLLAGLQALHAANMRHACLWAGSVLITQDQDLKLEAAAGLSLVERRLTEIVGGPATGYLAPEVVQGSPVAPESDIYSAGACLYFIMAGQDPFPGEDPVAIAEHVVERKPVPLSGLRDDVPPEAEEFIARLMSKDPTQRYGSVAAVLGDIARLKNGEALAPLQGGRPAAPPRAATPPPAPEPQAAAAPQPASTSAGARQTPGTRTVGLVGAAQAMPGTRVVFGRLDTHVKSTIPKSDVEKRGDDLFRQGQLVMALATWRDAYLNATPHAALKVKIELCEREAKREAYELAMDEARYRLGRQDFRSAISRAREAMGSADGEAERNEAVALESQALELQREALQAQKRKTKVLVAAAIAAIIALLLFLGRVPKEEAGADDSAERAIRDNIEKGTPARADQRTLAAGVASVVLPVPWTIGAEEARLTPGGGEQAVTFHLRQCSGITKASDRLNDLRKDTGIKGAQKSDDWENIAYIETVYSCSELGFRYPGTGGPPRCRFFYIVGGPRDTVYQAEFDALESLFTPELRAQMRQIMQTLKYRK